MFPNLQIQEFCTGVPMQQASWNLNVSDELQYNPFHSQNTNFNTCPVVQYTFQGQQ